MGFFDSIFSSSTKGEGFELVPQTENQKKSEQYLMDLINQKVTFDPRQIAEFPEAVQQAIATVNNIMTGGIPEINQAINVVADRMTGPVEEVPGLEGLFQRTKELGADLLGQTQRGLALTGNLPSQSSAGERIYGRTLQNIMNELVTSAYPYYQQGLQAKLNAPQDLANLAIQGTTIPLTLATTIGNLPGEREQSILDSIMEANRLTQTYPYTTQAPIASNILNRTAYAYNPGTTTPSLFSQAAPIAGALALGAMTGGFSGTTPMSTEKAVSLGLL